jgi:hypothetical protein
MIILIGFPKSGTSSFQSLFLKLGYKSFHWTKGANYIGMLIKKNKELKKPLLQGFEQSDCITQMDVCLSPEKSYWPQLIDYQQIYNENKDSIYILNKRDPYKLLSSFKRWSKMDQRLFNFSPELIENKTDEGFIEFVEKHYHDVELFFEEHKEAKFLSFDIDTDSLCKLEKYVNLRNEKKLPVCNVNPKKE